ncbi:Lysylphosphatidylglycerol synthetase, C-terminal domain, DUF2156 family [Paraoerskovia marina]|uniref:Lysylphosphatidylglycerol synthetase, C-terminal domain, DUF2156 family n=1 Tax=Paraoerskovia marina TaxID=545619 RepID=A0A1H1MVC8_9CELL|nr:phosphatidylglycerol lysyltransferase domain-containing protein [Paraoerskovia marina]SDR90395.1 Lysylphosphatidylglycerol synthetase, C-terminal domain, DUF2156 family [Paraoerskovia marina]
MTDLARRLPFTLGTAAVMVLLGLATGAFWRPFEDSSLFEDVAFGVPAFADGRWWTPVTGSFFALEPWQYVPVLGGFLLLVGFAELRLGTRRAALVTIVCQIAGVVGTALLVGLLARTTWAWANETAQILDVGFSAGFTGAATVAVLTLPRPWRGRLSALIAVYVLVAVLFIGGIADVEHLVGWVTALVLGRVVVRPPLGARTRTGRTRHARTHAAGYFAISALLTVLAGFAVHVDGPVGEIDGSSWPTGLVSIAVDLALAVGLLRGRRAWWRAALVLTILSTLVAAVLVTAALLVDTSEIVLVVLMLALDVGALVLLVARRDAFRNRRGTTLSTTGEMLTADDARTEIQRLGAGQRLAWMTTWEGSERWSPADLDGFVAYQVHAGVAVALTDPVGDGATGRADLVDAFVDAAGAGGVTTCFFSSSAELAALGRARGWTTVEVAEEAVVDLPGLEFRGKKWQDVRTAINQARKNDIEHRLTTLADEPPDVVAQVRAISEAWLGDSDLPEMAFTLGGIREALDQAVRVGLAVDADGRVHGVTSWLPVHAPGGDVVGWTLDVMRRAPDSFRYTMELLIASAINEFRDEGALELSLSGSPLARTGDVEPTGIDAVLDRLASTLEPLYGFTSLHRFKMKFQPRSEPLYLVVPDVAALPLVGLALVRCYLPDATASDFVSAARSSMVSSE